MDPNSQAAAMATRFMGFSPCNSRTKQLLYAEFRRNVIGTVRQLSREYRRRSARPYGGTVLVSSGIGPSLCVSRAPRGASVVETAEVSVALVDSSTRSEFPRVTAS